jgi:hemerythrin
MSREVDRQSEEFTGKLTELIADLRQEKEISRVLKRLADFADDAANHFRRQEARFPDSLSSFDAAEHRKRHRFFEHYLREPLLTVNGNQCETDDLCAFLTDWITFHHQYLDQDNLI